ncbi:MAG: GIY-YIG nuclease family protein [Aliarcobacter sp.]
MYQVYVLNNSADQKYIGLSQYPQTRLLQHNYGISRWTKGKGPWTIVWLSNPMSLSAARKLENKLKRQKGGLGLNPLVLKITLGS